MMKPELVWQYEKGLQLTSAEVLPPDGCYL